MKNVQLILGCIALSTIARAQQPPGPSVVIRYQAPVAIVEVYANTSLEAVLAEFCRTTGSDCTGTEHARGFTVSPLSIRGRWPEVLSQLMSGTGLNYVSRQPNAPNAGKIVVQVRTARANTPTSAYAAADAQASTAASPGTQAAPQSESVAASDAEADPPTGGETAHQGTPAPGPTPSNPVFSSAQTGVSGSPLTSEMPMMESTEAPASMPFPDAQQRPIPTSAPQFLPFPDSQGNLIPVKPPKPGMPFPSHPAVKSQH